MGGRRDWKGGLVEEGRSIRKVDILTRGRVENREIHQEAGTRSIARGHFISMPKGKPSQVVSVAPARPGYTPGRHGHWEWADLFRQRRQRALGRRSWAGREVGVTDGRHLGVIVWWCGWLVGVVVGRIA